MSPEISVVIPSLRPKNLRQCISDIVKYSEGVDYEIVVVSPFDICTSERIKHVPEVEPLGNAGATNLGYENSVGKYVLTIADDMLVNYNCLANLLTFMKPHDDELFLSSLRGYDATHLWNFWGFYGLLLAYCPCLQRRNIENIGGCFFDPTFTSVFGDHDLSLRVWQAGGNVAICPDAWFESISQVDEVHKANLNRNYERDSELFFGRWEPVYGKRVNYAKSVPEHVAYSRTKIKALPFKTPPEISWVLRSLFQAKQWENMRTLITNPDPELAMSRMGLSVFEAKLVRNATKVPSDLFDELLDWLITIENEFQAEAEVSE